MISLKIVTGEIENYDKSENLQKKTRMAMKSQEYPDPI